jgi:hypothetical protein
VSGQLHAPAGLPPVKNPGTDSVGSWVRHSRYGHFGEEKNLLPAPGFEPRILQHVARSLHLLRCPGWQLISVNSQILKSSEMWMLRTCYSWVHFTARNWNHVISLFLKSVVLLILMWKLYLWMWEDCRRVVIVTGYLWKSIENVVNLFVLPLEMLTSPCPY